MCEELFPALCASLLVDDFDVATVAACYAYFAASEGWEPPRDAGEAADRVWERLRPEYRFLPRDRGRLSGSAATVFSVEVFCEVCEPSSREARAACEAAALAAAGHPLREAVQLALQRTQ